MLLEEIKANLSSDEDTSSDELPEEEKKKPAKQTENTGDDGKHQKAPGKKWCCVTCHDFKGHLGKLWLLKFSAKNITDFDM